MSPQVIHTRWWRVVGPARASFFLPCFLQYHENQRALVTLCYFSSRNSFSALISINAENTRSHYAKI